MSFLVYRVKCKTCGNKFTFTNRACHVCHRKDTEHCYQCHNDLYRCNYYNYLEKRYRLISALMFLGFMAFFGIQL